MRRAVRAWGLGWGLSLLVLAGCARAPSPWDPARCGQGQAGCDLDGDGVTRESDCDDGDAAVYPGATEVPYDQVDQDCLGGDLTDVDVDGVASSLAGGEDCDDQQAQVYPGAFDVVGDGQDGNCRIPDDYIYSYAGNGLLGYGGDGGPASDAQLPEVYALAADLEGNLYVGAASDADPGSQVVRRIDPQGIITHFAGCMEDCLTLVEGPATQIFMSNVNGLATDWEGNLYIADTYGYKVHKVSSAGHLTPVAGNGQSCTPEALSQEATEACIGLPVGVAVDSGGNVYFAESRTHRVFRVDPEGGLEPYAGTGQQGYAGDAGAASQARLNYPHDLAMGPDDALYIADYGNARVRKVTAEGIISTVAGNGRTADEKRYSADDATLVSVGNPDGVSLDGAGNLYIASPFTCWVQKVNPSGALSTVAGINSGGYDCGTSGDGGPATLARLINPYDVAVDGAGNLYLTQFGGYRIRVVRP